MLETPAIVYRVRADVKKKWRLLADAVADIGPEAIGHALTHEERCGLVFNSRRIAIRRAYPFYRAISACFGELDREWYDALSRSPEEAEESYSAAQFRQRFLSSVRGKG